MIYWALYTEISYPPCGHSNYLLQYVDVLFTSWFTIEFVIG